MNDVELVRNLRDTANVTGNGQTDAKLIEAAAERIESLSAILLALTGNGGGTATLFGFAETVLALDTYRGEGTKTLKGAGLHFHLANHPDVQIIATLMPEVLRALSDDLNRIIDCQDRE